MINRLVAENTLKFPFKGVPYFSVTKKLICYRTEANIKIKNLSRDVKDIDIPQTVTPISFGLS
jgi:hypothetical protein